MRNKNVKESYIFMKPGGAGSVTIPISAYAGREHPKVGDLIAFSEEIKDDEVPGYIIKGFLGISGGSGKLVSLRNINEDEEKQYGSIHFAPESSAEEEPMQ